MQARDAEALAWRGNPVDTLAPLAQAKVAIIHVIGDADVVVFASKNSDVIEQRQATGRWNGV